MNVVNLGDQDVGVNVHYTPVHLYQFYQNRFEYLKELCPIENNATKSILSIPIFLSLKDEQVQTVLAIFDDIQRAFA